jgi:hypothetical protein
MFNTLICFYISTIHQYQLRPPPKERINSMPGSRTTPKEPLLLQSATSNTTTTAKTKTSQLSPELGTWVHDLGSFPASWMNCKYHSLSKSGAFLLGIDEDISKPILIAGVPFHVGQELGYICGQASSCDTVSLEQKRSSPLFGISMYELEHGVIVTTSDSTNNLLQCIRRTTALEQVNCRIDTDGRVLVSTAIEVGKPFFLLSPKLPVRDAALMEKPRKVQWRSVLESSFDANNWIRCCRDDLSPHISFIDVKHSPHCGKFATYIDKSLAYKHKLLVLCENTSESHVAAIRLQTDDFFIPAKQSMLFPAYMSLKERIVEGATLHLSLISASPIHGNELSYLIDRIQESLYDEPLIFGCTERHALQYNDFCLPGKPLNWNPDQRESHGYRADFPFELADAPRTVDACVVPRSSSLPSSGTGLYTTAEFKKGDIVCSYGGALMHRDEYKIMSLKQPLKTNYIVSVPHEKGSSTFVIDGRLQFGFSMGRFANEPDNVSKANVTPEWIITSKGPKDNKHTGFIGMKASKPIPAGAEVFFNYGPGYPRNYC